MGSFGKVDYAEGFAGFGAGVELVSGFKVFFCVGTGPVVEMRVGGTVVLV